MLTLLLLFLGGPRYYRNSTVGVYNNWVIRKKLQHVTKYAELAES